MKREKARLAELRRMPYEEYIETPEWQAVAKAALKRAGKRCQGCKAENVVLSVYHTTLDTIGCEQEDDVLVLCEACFDQLSQQGKLALEDAEEGENEEPSSLPHFSFGKRAAIFLPSALIGMGLPALLHAPLPAEAFGLIAAIVVAVKSPRIYAEMRESLPQPLVDLLENMSTRKQERARKGEWSTWDRLLNRHMHQSPVDQPEEEEAVDIFDEDDEQQDHLNLGPTLKPHANSMLSGRKVILGVSGSGKTNAVDVYCEELGKLDPAPAIILFDTDDENRGICHKPYFPNPLWLDKSRGLSTKTAYKTAQQIMDKRYQCVINLQSFEDEEAAWIMINMIKGVKAWQEARTVRIPCEIVLDEASVWLPQYARESLLSSILIDDADVVALIDEDQDEEEEEEILVTGQVTGKEKASKKITLLSLLQRIFFSTVRRGRRRGMGFTLAAQRIAEIDKRALQGSWVFLMRQTQTADFKEYAKYGISAKDAMELLDGEAFIFSPGKPLEKHRLRKSDSPHTGITPGMNELRGKSGSAHQEVTPMSPSASLPARAAQIGQQKQREQTIDLDTLLLLKDRVDEQTFLALIERLPVIKGEDNPAAPRTTAQEPRQSGREEGRPRTTGTSHSKKHSLAKLQAAYNAYQPGMKYQSLARRLSVSTSEAWELLQQLRADGYIDAAGMKTQEDQQAPSQESQEEYERAVAIWQELERKQRANVRDFAAAMSTGSAKMGETKAYKILCDLVEQGRIQWERRKKKGAV